MGAPGSDDVSVRFFLPHPALRGAISTYYVLRIVGDASVEDLLHPEWPNIRLLLKGDWSLTFADGRVAATAAPGAVVSGTLGRSVVARGEPGLLAGVGLLPAGWAKLTARPAADFADQLQALSLFVGPEADVLLAALMREQDDDGLRARLDEWFLRRIGSAPQIERLLVDAHAALLDPGLESVADWAARLSRSTRQLERLARAYFGLSPKVLLRRQRFLRTLASIRDQPPGAWGRLVDERYVDQPHFVRDFKFFMGMAPRAYFARPSPFMTAAGNARLALLGAPLQGLHPSEEGSGKPG